MKERVLQALQEAQAAQNALLSNTSLHEQIAQAAQLLADTFKKGGRVFSCGNGGSMSDAMHFAEELTGRFRGDRKALPAIAISDPGHLSCVANDYGWEHVFSRYLEAHGRAGDVLLAISTSGKSPNILKAAEMARHLGLKVIALTGKTSSPLTSLTDIELCTPGGRYADRVQELHIQVIHTLIELVEAHHS